MPPRAPIKKEEIISSMEAITPFLEKRMLSLAQAMYWGPAPPLIDHINE